MRHGQHYRCSECGKIWVWMVDEWMICENPEHHLAVTRRELPHVAKPH
jgi:hypothetical protein